jgi:hypothetical protein
VQFSCPHGYRGRRNQPNTLFGEVRHVRMRKQWGFRSGNT